MKGTVDCSLQAHAEAKSVGFNVWWSVVTWCCSTCITDELSQWRQHHTDHTLCPQCFTTLVCRYLSSYVAMTWVART